MLGNAYNIQSFALCCGYIYVFEERVFLLKAEFLNFNSNTGTFGSKQVPLVAVNQLWDYETKESLANFSFC